MYYIVNIKTNEVLTFDKDRNIIWTQDMYHPLYLDTKYDACVVIKMLIQYTKLKECNLEVRKLIHD